MEHLDRQDLEIILRCLANAPLPYSYGDKKKQLEKLIKKLNHHEKAIVI